MHSYPIHLNLRGRRCLVIGGGSVAERKVRDLVAARAAVTVVSPVLAPGLAAMAAAGEIIYTQDCYRREYAAGFFLVICATDSREINAAAAGDARAAGALVNVIDDPALCDFTVPAHISRGDLMLTVSTGGKSPALARRLKEELAARYGEEYGEYLELVARHRERLKQAVATPAERGRMWREQLDETVLQLLRQGKIKEAEEKISHGTNCTGTQL